MQKLTLDIPEEVVEMIAARAAEILAEQQANAASPWLNAQEAAERLRCNRDRIYDLIQIGKLTARHDGRRVLVAREEIDRYVRSGG